MLTETFIAATQAVNKPSAHLSSALKDVGIFHYEFQPQNILRHGYKKSSVKPNCFAISDSHIFAAQADKAVIHVYSREKGNQEATVPFPDKILSLAYARETAILVIGTEDGKLVLWEIATGRISTSAAAHLEAISTLAVIDDHIISGSVDSNIHVWSLAQLVQLGPTSKSYNDTTLRDAPIRTFSHHKTAITALEAGHSKTTTNFAVSSSDDRTCYLWHIETCVILRTILTPSTTISIALDPADRVVYFGNDDGSLQSVDLLTAQSKASQRSLYDTEAAAPIQLMPKDNWSASSLATGAARCLTLSYDGTTLLSGHEKGIIVQWDVAKHRMTSEIADLHQPVNCIAMLIPDGLQHNQPGYVIKTIVKPRLELNAESTDSTVGIPASYTFTAQVTQDTPLLENSEVITAILAGDLFPDSMLDDAIQAMNAKSAGISDSTLVSTATGNKNDMYKIQSLEEDKATLQKQLAIMQRLHDDAQERHQKRNARREKIGQQRREAYFAAKKRGKDGDEAMKPFEKKLEAIDDESEEEELEADQAMDVDV